NKVLMQNWAVHQEWDISATPIDMQKPYEIKKNRPKLKKGEKAPTSGDDEEEEEDDIFGDDMFGGYNDPYSNARRNNRNR
ncbi:MAG: hypothetical protein K2K05_02195, partial [Muribaculaceae bacterium]|nr:hypothetical protein [Muribaculaceae bacterium]